MIIDLRSHFGEYHPTICKGMNIFGNEQEKRNEKGEMRKEKCPCGVIVRMGYRLRMAGKVRMALSPCL
jgi:hypothetical protein